MLLLNKYLNGKIAEMIEHGLVAASTLLVAHGVAQSQATDLAALFNPQAIAGAIVGLLNLGWSMWRAHASNKLVSAVKTGEHGGQVLTSASVGTGTIASVVAFLLFVVSSSQAQTSNNIAVLSTNSTTLIQLPAVGLVGTLSTNQQVAANDLLSWIEPLIPYLKTNKIGTLTLDGTYSTGGKYGGLADFEVPVSSVASIGIGGAYVANNWFLAPVGGKLGDVYNLPLIGKVYTFTEAGLSLRYNNSAIGLQSATGAAKTWTINPQWQVTIDGGKLLFTQANSPSAWFGGLRVTYAWGK